MRRMSEKVCDRGAIVTKDRSLADVLLYQVCEDEA